MKCNVLLAAAVLAIAAQSASAVFIFSDVRTPVSATHERIVISAFNDGTGYTAGGTRLRGLEMTVTTNNPMTFNAADVNFDGLTDISITAGTNTLGNTSITGTKVASEVFSELFNLGLFGPNPLPENISTDSYDAVAAFSNLKSFYALGMMFGPGAGITANQGAGAKFLTVVAPKGTTVSITGGIAGEVGTAGTAITAGALQVASLQALPFGGSTATLQEGLTPFSYVSVVPEPTALAALAGAGVVFGRRRRA